MRSNRPGDPIPLVKLLYPGIRIKRWLLLLLLGLIGFSLGVAYVLVDIYRSADVPDWFVWVTLQVLPRPIRALVCFAVGSALFWYGLLGLYRSLADVFQEGPGHARNATLIDTLYDQRLRRGGPKIACIGGGTGMPSVLRALKAHTSNITAIVTVGDDGGSSGRLRREHGILPPGDFRNNIVALAEVEPLMARLFQYRFGGGSALDGHSFGNLFMLAMSEVTGNFDQALRETSRVLAVKGTILPSTLQDVEICARFTDGTSVCGESRVPEAGKPIDRIFLQPEHPAAQPEAVKAVLDADLVVLGPGSLYTSVIPNLLVEGVAKALQQTEALKVYVCNVATQPGETDGYDVEHHVEALARHLPGGANPLDVVLAHRHLPGSWLPDARVTRVEPRKGGGARGGPRVVLADVVREDQPLRHDSDKLGQALMSLLFEWRRR